MLEQKIDALIEALDRNTAAQGGTAPGATAVGTKKAPTPAAAKAKAIPYTDVQKAVANLANSTDAGKGKPAVKAILGEFNVTKAQELSEDQYGPFIAKLEAKLAEEAEEDLS